MRRGSWRLCFSTISVSAAQIGFEWCLSACPRLVQCSFKAAFAQQAQCVAYLSWAYKVVNIVSASLSGPSFSARSRIEPLIPVRPTMPPSRAYSPAPARNLRAVVSIPSGSGSSSENPLSLALPPRSTCLAGADARIALQTMRARGTGRGAGVMCIVRGR